MEGIFGIPRADVSDSISNNRILDDIWISRDAIPGLSE